MNKNKFLVLLVAVYATMFWACKPEIKELEPSAGNANFSRYVAIGNSITAGYADGALFKSGQDVAYPNIMAKQFALAGGGSFNTPWMNDNLGGFLIGGNPIGLPKRVMGYPEQIVCGANNEVVIPSTLTPVLEAGVPTTEILNNIYTASTPFQNIGVPGAKIYHFDVAGYGNPAGLSANLANPYFVRMASSATASMQSDAVAQNPTFFTFWLGNNDVLGFATEGGIQSTNNPAPTPSAVFDAKFTAAIDALTANGAKGAVATIPDITALPYFTTIAWDNFIFTEKDTALLRRLNTDFNGLLPQVLGYTFKIGRNPFIVQDSSVAGFYIRTARPTDLICLPIPATEIKCGTAGIPVLGGAITLPGLKGKYFLNEAEVNRVKSSINAYNAKIRQVADAKGLALVDANAVFNSIKDGAIYDGVSVSNKFVTGGLFSLDGVHPTPRGQAIIANEFIKAINKKYGATIPTVNVADYFGVKLP